MFKDTFAWLSSDTVAVKIWFSNCNAKPLLGLNTVRSGSFLVLWPGGREHQHSPGEGRNAPGCSGAQPEQPEIFLTSSGWQVFLQIGTCTLIVIMCDMNINICFDCIRESTYSKAQPPHVHLSSLNIDLPLEVNSIDICIDSEDIGSDNAFIHIFVKIPIVEDHVCLEYFEQLCFVPAVYWN